MVPPRVGWVLSNQLTLVNKTAPSLPPPRPAATTRQFDLDTLSLRLLSQLIITTNNHEHICIAEFCFCFCFFFWISYFVLIFLFYRVVRPGKVRDWDWGLGWAQTQLISSSGVASVLFFGFPQEVLFQESHLLSQKLRCCGHKSPCRWCLLWGVSADSISVTIDQAYSYYWTMAFGKGEEASSMEDLLSTQLLWRYWGLVTGFSCSFTI